MLTELFLVRHGEPDRNTGVPYTLPPGPPLLSVGRDQAAQAGAWLADKQVDHVFTSPFIRAASTAEIIVARTGLPLTYVDALREGAPGEGEAKVRIRTAELLAQIEDGPHQRVALVAHGIVLFVLLKHTTADRIDLSNHRYDHGNNTPTAGIWYGRRGESGAWVWDLAFRPTVALGDVVQV